MVIHRQNAKLAFFLTEGNRLQDWKEAGTLERELRLYEGLREAGYETVIFSWGELEPEVPFRVVPMGRSLAWAKGPLRALGWLLLPFLYWSELKQCTVIKSNQVWGAWIPAWCSLWVRRPFLFRCGYEALRNARYANESLLLRAILRSLSFFAYRMAWRIHVASPEDRDFIAETHGAGLLNRIHLHPNWVDPDLFSPISAKPERALLFVGRLSEEKNLPPLIEACDRVGLPLHIVGDGPLRADLEAISEGKDVTFMGRRPNAEVGELLPRYAIYGLVSHYEGTPKTLLEAMSCGVACMGTRVAGIGCLLEDGVNGRLCGLDADSMSGVLQSMLDDPESLVQMGKAAREMILRDYTFDALLAKEVSALESMTR